MVRACIISVGVQLLSLFATKQDEDYDGAASYPTSVRNGGYGREDHISFQGDDSFLRIIKVVD